MRDISTNGIGMLCSRRFEPGAFLAIQFVDVNNGQAKTRTAQVMHVAASQSGWMLGCAFRSPFPADELAAMLGGSIAT